MEVPATAEEDMGQKRLFCRAQVSGYALDEEGRVKRDEDGKPVWGKRECHAPLFANDVGDKRYPIADYIFRHAKFRFNMLIADEVHKFKGKSSDRGIAYHQLVQSVRYTINLTGTFFGGPSTSIFWLLQRNDPKVSRDFDFHDERRWAARYGVLEFRRLSKKGYNEDETEVGFTGNRRYQNIAKELPGISPSIINRLLHNTVFLSLKDLGLVLPEYTEEVAALNMLPRTPSAKATRINTAGWKAACVPRLARIKGSCPYGCNGAWPGPTRPSATRKFKPKSWTIKMTVVTMSD